MKIKFPWNKKDNNNEIEMPDRIVISFTDEALDKGVLDDFNKEIKRYKNGIIIERREYRIEMVRSMAKTYGLPVLDLTKTKDMGYEFNEVMALRGEIRRFVKV